MDCGKAKNTTGRAPTKELFCEKNLVSNHVLERCKAPVGEFLSQKSYTIFFFQLINLSWK